MSEEAENKPEAEEGAAPSDIYRSADDANTAAVMNTVAAATKAGYTQQSVDDGHVLCQKPDTMQLVDVFPDGSWEYQNATDDGKMEEMSGTSATMLALYLHSAENKSLFETQE